MAVRTGNHADVFRPLQPDAVGGQQFLVFVDLGGSEIEELNHVALKALVSFVLAAADAEGMRGQPSAAILFENLQNLFPVAEGVKKRRHGADIESVRAQPKLMARQAIQFRENYPNIFGSRRRFDVEEFFDRFAVAQPVRDRGHIIHAVDVGIEHGVSAVLGNFFDPAMQVADHALRAQNLLAIQLEDHAQHSVGRRMLRAHVDDELIAVEKGLVGLDRVPGVTRYFVASAVFGQPVFVVSKLVRSIMIIGRSRSPGWPSPIPDPVE